MKKTLCILLATISILSSSCVTYFKTTNIGGYGTTDRISDETATSSVTERHYHDVGGVPFVVFTLNDGTVLSYPAGSQMFNAKVGETVVYHKAMVSPLTDVKVVGTKYDSYSGKYKLLLNGNVCNGYYTGAANKTVEVTITNEQYEYFQNKVWLTEYDLTLLYPRVEYEKIK